jgi:hypothetical protein
MTDQGTSYALSSPLRSPSGSEMPLPRIRVFLVHPDLEIVAQPYWWKEAA